MISRSIKFLPLVLIVFFLSGCDRPPEDKIYKDFNSIIKIHPVTNKPRPEWEETRAAGYTVNKIYIQSKKTIVELELKKPYYNKKNIAMYYNKLQDGEWKWIGWNFIKK